MGVTSATRSAPAAAPPDLDAILPRLTQRFAATADEHDRDATFPFENFAVLHKAGLLTLTTPRDLGGQGADLPTALRVIQAVARGEPSTALVLVMQSMSTARSAAAPAGPTTSKLWWSKTPEPMAA